MNESCRALVLTRYFEPAFRGGGPIQTISALVRARPAHTSAAVICSNSDLGTSEPLVDYPDQWMRRGDFSVWYTRPTARGAIEAFVKSRKPQQHLIYINSFFEPVYSLIPQLLHGCGLWGRAGLVIAPRGELSPGALAIKAPKKRLFIALYRLLGQHRRVLWHASAELEAEEIRQVFGRSVQVAIRENEADLPALAQRRGPRPSVPCRLVYASRIVPKKGLLIALEALTEVADLVDVDVIGAFEDGDYEASCRKVIRRLPENVHVHLHGALRRSALIEVLHRSDIMLLPTAGENFGHVIPEALSKSCPVMCSDTTPWTARLEKGAGEIVRPNSPDAWASAIRMFIAGGTEHWTYHSERAADAFDEWRSEDKGRHILDLAQEHYGLSGSDVGDTRRGWRFRGVTRREGKE